MCVRGTRERTYFSEPCTARNPRKRVGRITGAPGESIGIFCVERCRATLDISASDKDPSMLSTGRTEDENGYKSLLADDFNGPEKKCQAKENKGDRPIRSLARILIFHLVI